MASPARPEQTGRTSPAWVSARVPGQGWETNEMVNKAEDSGQNPSHSVQQTPYSRARHRSRLSRDPRSRDMVSALVELTVWWEKDVAERGRVSVPRATCQGAMCCVTGAQRRKHVIEPGET